MLDQGTPKLQRGTISRRALLGAAAAIPLVAIRTRPARAAEFDYKLATGQSLTQPINARLDQAVKRIKEASGGKLDINISVSYTHQTQPTTCQACRSRWSPYH